VLIAYVLLRQHGRSTTSRSAVREGTDRWRPFLTLTGIEVVRSVAFFGINTFIELYWIHRLHASKELAGAALACFLVGGVGGTLLGGRIADHIGLVRTVQLGGALVLPMMIGLRATPNAYAALLFAAATGLALNIPFAVLVKLGQDYLPTRPGTAAGVTLGLGVSIGGMVAPLLGLLADAHGPQAVLAALCAVPIGALGLGLLLPEPGQDEPSS